jgi:hypothetical protein
MRVKRRVRVVDGGEGLEGTSEKGRSEGGVDA